MFCSQCGGTLQVGAKFCSGCGAPSAPGEGGATHGQPSGARFAVSVQGFDVTARRATGDDATIELGSMTLEEIGSLADKMAALPAGATEVPPHLMVAGAKGTVSAIIEGGAIAASDSGRKLTRDQLLARISGARPAEPEPPRAEFPRGMRPLRRAELLPTQPEVKDNPRLIDTGAASPQRRVRLWKGRGHRATAWFFLWFGVFLAVIGGLASLPGPGSESGGGGFFFIAAVLVGLHFAVKSAGKEDVALGIDWKTNTLWLSRQGNVTYEPHASCIREVRSSRLRLADGVQFVNGGVVKRGTDVWHLQIEYADGHVTTSLSTSLLEAGEARAVCDAARGLLASGS